MGTPVAKNIDDYNVTFIDFKNRSSENSKFLISHKEQSFPLLHDHWENALEAPYGVHIFIGMVALIVGSGGLVGNILVISLFVR